MPAVFSMFCSGPIIPERIVLAGIVTLASAMQLGYFAYYTFKSRERLGVHFPATTGQPEFDRIFRAQQNSLEVQPIFMATLWTATIFFHQVPASICGVMYLISRHIYFRGYCRSVEGRIPGAKMTARVLKALLVLSGVGLVRTMVGVWRDPQGPGVGVFLPWRTEGAGDGSVGVPGASAVFPASRIPSHSQWR